MTKRVLPGLGLTAFWPYGSDNWNTDMDANLVLLAALANCAVASRVTLIASADQSKVYLVPSNAATNANKIAIYNNDVEVPANSGWIYITPKEGWRVFVIDEAAPLDFLYGAWAPNQFTFSKPYMVSGYDQRWRTDITVAAAFTQTAGRQTTRYRAAMTFCNLDLELTTAAAVTDGTTITTLPSDCRPPAAIMIAAASPLPIRVVVGTDGTVKIYGASAATNFALHTNFSLL